ncbi:MAG: mercuric reductase [Gemmatimonadota bacterium]|nr:mercuric reductase [Gemmatimonadota bacterium]MDE3126410.1 mercuric reductase [Gemmatimonadota bacterium]
MAPFDAYNAEWASRVNPRDWRNPEPAPRYHLVVIGGGTAGLVSAAIAAGLGARVALVECDSLGGDCLNVGCVPSKALIRAARGWHDARRAAESFGGPETSGSGDSAAALSRMRALRAELSRVDSAERYRSLGVDVFLGEARFASPDAVTVGDSVLRFRRAIVATGARAAVPPIPGLAATPFDTNASIFTLASAPARLIVLGGGPIGAELAQAFARLGSIVTLVHSGQHLLPREDPDAGRVVAAALMADGVSLHHGMAVSDVGWREGVFTLRSASAGLELRADRLLVATGRAPNVEDMGLDAAGIAYSSRGVTVDDRLRTTNRRVFAIGDVASRLQFTHVADAQARLAVANALFFGAGGGRNSRLVVPRVTYTSPEVATVGLTEAEAIEGGHRVETVVVPMAEVDRAALDGDGSGFLKIVLRAGSDRILGGTLVADHAGEMISELTLAMSRRIGLSAVGATVHPYPTQGAVYRRAADAWRRARLTPSAQRVLRAWFRWFA